MAKIVYMSDSPTITTGYGRVTKTLCQAFVDAGHEVDVIGWGYTGEKHDLPYNIIPCNTDTDRMGEDILAQYIVDQQPDILFTLGDPWMTEFVPYLEERRAVKWISYFPIDGYPIPPDWHAWIRNADYPVVFSKFAQELVFQAVGKKPTLIYHGVDTDLFKPMDKSVVKEEYGADGKFIVGTVARNQPRKNLPALVKAFSIFAKNKPDTLLYMHSQIHDVGWKLDELVTRFGITDKAFTTSGLNATRGIPDEELVEIYNLFDLFALPTMSEGFGLPILEAQSCGVPVLVTDFSACSELVVDRQELIKVKDTLIMGRNIEQAIVDTDDLVRKLNFFYDDWKRRKGKKLSELSIEGRKFAQKLDWKAISKEFNELIEKADSIKKEKRIYPSFYKI
jgi:glycosyltransferase involved in cell wall biosynthesis